MSAVTSVCQMVYMAFWKVFNHKSKVINCWTCSNGHFLFIYLQNEFIFIVHKLWLSFRIKFFLFLFGELFQFHQNTIEIDFNIFLEFFLQSTRSNISTNKQTKQSQSNFTFFSTKVPIWQLTSPRHRLISAEHLKSERTPSLKLKYKRLMLWVLSSNGIYEEKENCTSLHRPNRCSLCAAVFQCFDYNCCHSILQFSSRYYFRPLCNRIRITVINPWHTFQACFWIVHILRVVFACSAANQCIARTILLTANRIHCLQIQNIHLIFGLAYYTSLNDDISNEHCLRRLATFRLNSFTPPAKNEIKMKIQFDQFIAKYLFICAGLLDFSISFFSFVCLFLT